MLSTKSAGDDDDDNTITEKTYKFGVFNTKSWLNSINDAIDASKGEETKK